MTDLAISGDGFFVVSDPDGTPYLTRAGSFVPDGDGNLVNAAGFKLMGYALQRRPRHRCGQRLCRARAGQHRPARAAGRPLRRRQSVREPALDRDGGWPARCCHPHNAATAEYTAKTSLVAYDNLGEEVTLDMYYTKTGAQHVGSGCLRSGGRGSRRRLSLYGRRHHHVHAELRADHRAAHQQPASFSFTVPGGAALTLDISQTMQLAGRLLHARRAGQRQRAERGGAHRDRRRRHALCRLRERRARADLPDPAGAT